MQVSSYPQAPLLRRVSDVPTQWNGSPQSGERRSKGVEQRAEEAKGVRRTCEDDMGVHRGIEPLISSVAMFHCTAARNTWGYVLQPLVTMFSSVDRQVAMFNMCVYLNTPSLLFPVPVLELSSLPTAP